MAFQQRTTKKQKRVIRQSGEFIPPTLLLQTTKPMTANQEVAFESWADDRLLMLYGLPGTGKTFLACYFALLEALKTGRTVKIIRSTVSSRDQGFMPGGPKEKAAMYEAAYRTIFSKLYGRSDAYEIAKAKGLVEFVTTSFLRGETFDDCILIVDESQNCSVQELHTVMTRIGENCRIIFCGDMSQDDLSSERRKETSGLREFMKIIKKMPEFDFIEFGIDDIIRSQLVKSYIIAKYELGL